jgi:hypothetical protein
MVVGVERRPIAPVVSSNAARTAVATFQRLYLSRKSHFVKGWKGHDFSEVYVLLAMCDRLFTRKLKLTAETARDLIRLVNAPPLTEAHTRDYEYLAAIFKQIDRCFVPPVPPLLREPLLEMHATLSTPFAQAPWRSQKATVPKRHQNACKRIERLLVEP